MDLPFRIGTRGSPLAQAQANDVAARLRAAHAELADPAAIEIRVIKTSGDRIQSGPLADVGGKGLFTKEIEQALIDNEIDVAVHSMKDVPTELPPGLVLDTYLTREDPRDALISPSHDSLAGLPEGAVVGTSSLRRKAQLLAARPDLVIIDFRGNVGTRLEKLARGEAAATLLAAAGLNRLGKQTDITAILSPDEMLPAVCQGIVGIELRDGDNRARDFLLPLGDGSAADEAAAERALLAALDGSCRTPIAALARVSGDNILLNAQIISPDGQTLHETTRSGARSDAAILGHAAGEELRARGGPGFFD